LRSSTVGVPPRLGTMSICMDPANQAESRRVKQNLQCYMGAADVDFSAFSKYYPKTSAKFGLKDASGGR
jgi:hypothetical protein